MATVLLLTNSLQPAAEIVPTLGLLQYEIRVGPAEAAALIDAPAHDAVLVDGRRDLAGARSLTRLLRTTGVEAPVILVVTEGGLAAVQTDWGIDDVVLESAGPAEFEARLRLAQGRLRSGGVDDEPDQIRRGALTIDEAGYAATIDGRTLDLTFKEFELLRYLAQHPGRVFSRAQLLQEVWGYDYYGGTRTVDVHVRRLRSKLGSENEALVGTVRNVGYRFVPENARRTDEEAGEEQRREESRGRTVG
jgi:DNA-binding response OmpR family regulator